MRDMARMRTDHKLAASQFGVFEIWMGAKNFVGLANKHLLDLRVEMRLGLLDQDEMQRLYHGSGIGGRGFAHTHPQIPEAHQSEDHRDEVLIAEPVVVFG